MGRSPADAILPWASEPARPNLRPAQAIPRDQRVTASKVPERNVRSGRASAVDSSNTRSSSVTMLVSSRLLVAFDFRVSARRVICPAS